MSDGERGGVEATAREILHDWIDEWGEARFFTEEEQIGAFNDLEARIAAALRAAPTLEHSRLEGTAIGQPTSVVTHDSEGRGMRGDVRAVATELVESILAMAEKCDGRTLYFKRGIATKGGDFIGAQEWMVARAIEAIGPRQDICGECWYQAWTPAEAEADCDFDHPHEGEHARCDFCYMTRAFAKAHATPPDVGQAP